MTSGDKELRLSFDNDFDLWVLLDQTRYIISRARELELDQCNLTQKQASILFTIINNGGTSTLADISKTTVRRHHSVSSLIDRMVKRGLVKKERHSNSENIKIIVTEEGKRIFERIPLLSLKMTFSSLTAEDRQMLGDCLLRLREKARNLLGVDYRPPFLTDQEKEDVED